MPTPGGVEVPQITQEELYAFHTAHFSQDSVRHFHGSFLDVKTTPEVDDVHHDDDAKVEPGEDVNEHVDEHIDDHAGEPMPTLSPVTFGPEDFMASSPPEDKTLSAAEQEPSPNEPVRKRRRRKKNKNGNGSNNVRAVEKPDLRKRTWDVVDTGLESLDYGNVEMAATPTAASRPKRQLVQYDDA